MNDTVYVLIRFITDRLMSYSARKLGAVLCGLCDHTGTYRTTYAELKDITGLSVNTLQKAASDLEYWGLLTQKAEGKQGTVYSLRLDEPGVSLPRSLVMDTPLKGSAYVINLFRHLLSGNELPSINQTCRALDMPASTVCKGKKRIRAAEQSSFSS